jgi:hypothetical protein
MASRRFEGGGSLRSVHEGGAHEPEGTQDETDSTPFFISCFTGLDLRKGLLERGANFSPEILWASPEIENRASLLRTLAGDALKNTAKDVEHC